MDKYSLNIFFNNVCGGTITTEHFNKVKSVSIDKDGFFEIIFENGDITSIKNDSIVRFELIKLGSFQ